MSRKKKQIPPTPQSFSLGKWLGRPATSRRSPPPDSPTVWPYLLLAALTIALYAPALANGFAADDAFQLLSNPLVKDYHHLPDIFSQDVWGFRHEVNQQKTNYYRPVQFVAYMAIYYAVGFNAFWFHLAMVLLHVANTLLVLRLALLFLGKPDQPLYPAVLAAAIFAVHAINTDTVAWIAALPDLLMTVVVLTTLVLFARWQADPNGWQIAGLSSLFLLGMFTKETTVVAPAVLAGYAWLYLGRPLLHELWSKRWLYLSLIMVFALYLIARAKALGGLAPAQGQSIHLSGKQAVFSAIVLMAEYFAKLVVPWNASQFHVFKPTSTVGPIFLLSLGGVAAFLAAMFWTRKKFPVLCFSLLVILLPILPVMNLTGVTKNVFAERYLYLPSVGLAWAAAWMWARKPSWALAGCVLAIFAFMTFARIPDWKDTLHLYEAAVRKDPDNPGPHAWLGMQYQAAGKNQQAEEQYRESLRLDPTDDVTHNNFAVVLIGEHKYAEAMEQFQTALTYQPSSAMTYHNIGLLMLLAKRNDEAAAAFRKALRLNPDDQDSAARLKRLTNSP